MRRSPSRGRYDGDQFITITPAWRRVQQYQKPPKGRWSETYSTPAVRGASPQLRMTQDMIGRSVRARLASRADAEAGGPFLPRQAGSRSPSSPRASLRASLRPPTHTSQRPVSADVAPERPQQPPSPPPLPRSQSVSTRETPDYERPRWRTERSTTEAADPDYAAQAQSQPRFLIPEQLDTDRGKLVVVLDLDETLVYGREGFVHERPGTAELLRVLKDRCEVIVWTAGTREYALEVIRLIDTERAVQHCIFRHPMWYKDEANCVKDIRMLGRPREKVLFLDNTPEVFRANPGNSLLVKEYCAHPSSETDDSLSIIADILHCVLERFPVPRLAHVLASRRIIKSSVRMDDNRLIEVNILKRDKHFFAQALNCPLSRVYSGYM